MTKIIVENNHYSTQIKSFIHQEFIPNAKMDKADVLDALTEAFIASTRIRLGSRPNPESTVLMRKVFSDCIERDVPIPVLVPSGPKKPGLQQQSLDIAELSALRQISCLQARVKAVFKPGIVVRIRFEDLTGLLLEGPEAENAIYSYIKDFVSLVHLLEYKDFIHPVLESHFTDQRSFIPAARALTPLFEEYLNATEPNPDSDHSDLRSYQALVREGWVGMVGSIARSYYYARYAKMNIPVENRIAELSLYFAGSLARKKLNATGANPAWRGHIALGFTTVPVDPYAASTRLYYRSAPTNHCSTSIPYWRACGYLRISDSATRIGLIPWDSATGLMPCSATLSDGLSSVTIKTDYTIE